MAEIEKNSKHRDIIPVMKEKRIRLDLEFDGTGFFGWQLQARERTVQGEIEKVFHKIYGSRIRITGAGRTDTGVHAKHMAAHCDLPPKLEKDRLLPALNGNLPRDIRIFKAEAVSSEFHARFSAKERWYRYVLAKRQQAIGRNYMWFPLFKYDTGIIKKSAKVLTGRHDFRSFSKPDPDRLNYECNVLGIRWEETDSTIEFVIGADRFLHHMVRNILGTLLDIGRGRIQPDELEEILLSKNRCLAGTNIPPNGLFLEKIVY